MFLLLQTNIWPSHPARFGEKAFHTQREMTSSFGETKSHRTTSFLFYFLFLCQMFFSNGCAFQATQSRRNFDFKAAPIDKDRAVLRRRLTVTNTRLFTLFRGQGFVADDVDLVKGGTQRLPRIFVERCVPFHLLHLSISQTISTQSGNTAHQISGKSPNNSQLPPGVLQTWFVLHSIHTRMARGDCLSATFHTQPHPKSKAGPHTHTQTHFQISFALWFSRCETDTMTHTKEQTGVEELIFFTLENDNVQLCLRYHSQGTKVPWRYTGNGSPPGEKGKCDLLFFLVMFA